MLTLEQIQILIDQVADRGLGRVEIEKAGFRIRIDGAAPAPVIAASAGAALAPSHSPSPSQAGQAQAAAANAATTEAATDPELHVVTSPIVGTFYLAPAPDADPFVAVGQSIEEGQVICIVEAMKLMNEIEADASGEVREIYARNGEPVEFGAPLLGLKLSS